MEAREALLTRRSIRRYKPDPISEEDLKEILEAGLSAPSAVNMQHWYFVAVQSPEALDEVKAVMGGVAEKFQPVLAERFSRNPEQIGITNRFLTTLGGAPVCVLAFFLKPDYPDLDGAMQSVSAALETCCWRRGIRASAPAGCRHPSAWASARPSGSALPPTRGSLWPWSPWATPTRPPRCPPDGTGATRLYKETFH